MLNLLLNRTLNLGYKATNFLTMDYLLGLLSTRYQKIDSLTSLNKRKKGEKLYLPLILTKNSCLGSAIMCSLGKGRTGKHLQMKCKKSPRLSLLPVNTTQKRSILFFLENLSIKIHLIWCSKAEEVDFLSDVAYLGKLNPSPS